MKIKLQILKKDNREELVTLLNNKKIWNNLKDYIPYPYTIKDADFFIELIQKQSPKQTFAIVNDTNQLLGVIGIIIQNDIHRMSAELGYWIGEPYWSKGIATSAIEQITLYGFEQLKLERIYAGVLNIIKLHVRH